MSILTTITREYILKAIEKIDANPELKTKRSSSTYDLIYGEKKYPPILVLSIANQLNNGKELLLSDFDNNIEKPFKYLRDNGFEIIEKEEAYNIEEKDFIDKINNFTTIVWLVPFLDLLKSVIEKSKLKIDDELISFTVYSKRKRVSINIGNRIAIAIEQIKSKNLLILYIKEEDIQFAREQKTYLKDDKSDHFDTLPLGSLLYFECIEETFLNKELIDAFHRGLEEFIPLAIKSPQSKRHNPFIYKAAVDIDYRNNLISQLHNSIQKMTEQVMIYEVKTAASSNAIDLFSNDSKYFYWNETKFKNLQIGDFVFVVNRTNKWVLFTRLDKIDIPTSDKGGSTIFSDLGKDFKISGNWNKFIRLEVVNNLTIPNDWVWQNLGSSETTYLNGSRIGLDSSENRIKNINQLLELSNDQLINDVLNNCLLNFTGGAIKKGPSIWFVTQGATFREDKGMKFLWAPEKGKDGNGRFYWDNVLKVKKGDIIFNYSEGELKGISLASNDGYKAENKDTQSPWGPNGFRVDIDLTILNPTLKSDIFTKNISNFNIYLSKVNNKPFSINGSINQGYLYEFSKEAGRYIRDIYNKPFGNKVIDEFFDKVKLTLQNNNIMEESDISILTAIKTKPFILLAGISGTGKSRLVRTLAYKTCSKETLRADTKKPGNFELIPVRPNWHDSSELMGYVSRINGEKYITTTFLQFIAKAWKNIDVPFFLCLDEMNLAPVEQYFAEYLSIIETRQVKDKKIGTDYIISKASFENHTLYSMLLNDLGLNEIEFSDGISIPNNLIVIGTVNMDETTHSFSRKVLDRAMTFEMNNVDLTAGLDNTKNDWSYPQTFISSEDVLGEFTSGAEIVNEFAESKNVIDFLININIELEGTPFKIAYRVRDEFLIYCYYASLNQTNSNWLINALDEMTSMKILSRIEGDESKTGSVLSHLQRILTSDYKKSNSKLKEMEIRLSTSGYTSFWS